MADEKQLETLLVVYLGQRTLNNGKVGGTFIRTSELDKATVDDFEAVERVASVFECSRDRASPLIVGACYDMPVALTGERITTARIAARKYVDMYHRKDIIVQAQCLHESARTILEADRQLKRMKMDTPLEGELKRLRELYARTPWSQRAGLEMAILNYIRRQR